MKIIILEGIATSGKSTLAERIKEQLKGVTVRIASEAETHEPIMKQTHELHVSFFENLIHNLVAEKPKVIIFERLYLTQAVRASATLAEYSTVEDLLASFDTMTVFLKVDEQTIADRVMRAAAHRDPSWGKYIKTKGTTENEIANYYIVQQQNQIDLLGSSKLPYMICDTTYNNYPEITRQILKKLQQK